MLAVGAAAPILGSCPNNDCDSARAGGGALPVIMSIIGPRETHDYRNYNLSAQYKYIKKNQKKVCIDCSEMQRVKQLTSVGSLNLVSQ